MNIHVLIIQILECISQKMVCKNYDNSKLQYYNFKDLTKESWIVVMKFLQESNFTVSDIPIDKTQRGFFDYIESLRLTKEGLEYLEKGKITVAYPAADLILSTAKSEYEREFQRTTTIDVKVAAVFAMNAFLYPFLIGLTKFEDVDNIETYFILFSNVPLLLVGIATAMLVLVIATKAYSNIKLKNIVMDEFIRANNEDVAFLLIKRYSQAVQKNRAINQKRTDYYKTSVVLIIMALVLGIVTYIMKVI